MTLSAEQQIDIEMRRMRTVEKALKAATDVIYAADPDEQDLLLTELTLRLAEKIVLARRTEILKRDLGL